MAIPIRMPDLGTTVEEFRLMRWLVHEGDAIALGDELAEIETDKAVTSLESPAKGIILRCLVDEDTLVRTGEILAYVGAVGESIPDDTAMPPATSTEGNPPSAMVISTVTNATRKVAPVVRNLAAKLGIELEMVQGTGQGGAITREDVQRVAQCLTASSVAPPTSLQPLAQGQAAVARAVQKSWAEIPHTYFAASIDMTFIQQMRASAKAIDMPVSYDAFLLRAMALALREMPAMGARWQEGGIVPCTGTHLALAVDIDDALYLPVLRDVDERTLAQLQAEITDTVTRIQQHTLPAERLSGGCMALSNLGMYPIQAFDPIIFPGHSAMLAVGAIQPTPVVISGQLAIRPLMMATLAVDHRIINGRLAAAFLSRIKAQLECGEI